MSEKTGKPKSLDELYTKMASGADPDAESSATLGARRAPDMQREAEQFNIFDVADLMLNYRSRLPMGFDRRAFHKISLIRGRSRIEYADQVVEVEGPALWLATPRVPYRWQPHDLTQTGYFCVFTDEFLLPAKSGILVDELSFFQPGGCPVLAVTDADFSAAEAVFQKMTIEIASSYAYKYDLLRAYLLELIHLGQKLQPAPVPARAYSAAERVAARFAELLERQFPLESPQQQLRLRTAADYAGQLAVHVNHLNRVLKETTGHTTTALIGGRVTQEAKMLLRQTDWTVSEVADSLGFADAAHFCHFFKRQTGLVPGAFRI